MTDKEKIMKCIELVWGFEEIYDGDDLFNFQNKELSTYTQHESIITTFNKYIQLEKENAELKTQIQEQQIIAMQRIADKELKIVNLETQIEKMKCCQNCSYFFAGACRKGIDGCYYCDKWEITE